MQENKLQEGISILYDMEVNNYGMTVAINRLNGEIARLGKGNKYYRPNLKENTVQVSTYAVAGLIGGAIIGAIIGIIVGFIVGDGFFDTIGSVIGYGIYVGIAGCIIGVVGGFAYGCVEANWEESRLQSEYQDAQEIYEKNVAGDKRRVQAELRRQNVLIAQRRTLENRLYEAQNKLADFYDTVGIDKNYRNIIPIGYMYDYMRLGIATKLEGVDGLNYLIRQELRQDQMQYTLNEISQKLDIIIDKQSSLYDELWQIRRSSEMLVQKTVESVKFAEHNNRRLSEIADNTSIAAYNSERIEQELAFQNFMIAYRSV